jgi:hypothetical protein
MFWYLYSFTLINFVSQYTQVTHNNQIQRVFYFRAFYYIKKFANEERRGNVTFFCGPRSQIGFRILFENCLEFDTPGLDTWY